MRSLLSLPLLFLCAASGVTAIASAKQQLSSSLCTPGFEHCFANYRNPQRQQADPTRTIPFGRKKLRLTNGQRLSRGMPLNAPKPHRTVQRRQEPSPQPNTPVSAVGSIIGPGSSPVGYLGAITTDGAIFGVESQLVDSAIMIVERTSQTAVENGVRITIPDSDIGQSYPILGLVQGRDNIDTNAGPGSYHYFYVSGVAQPGTAQGSTGGDIANSYSATSGVTRAVQTNVWTVNYSTGEVTAVWINSDGTPVNLQLFVQGSVIYATADINAFQEEYASVTPITLRILT
ncbi:hypothetical protein BJ165DRAFT_1523218 [Panaeolus papilionaceus]|nr:hypothetical protein BJ165DRAFT_1523218 [Panaeolus papilionaceus]